MNETQEATLESLKVGDVAYVEIGRYRVEQITIAKVTTTQFVDSDGKRYRREDGRSTETVNRWHGRLYLNPATPELTARYQRQENIALIERTNMQALSDEQLEAIARVLRGE